MPDFAVRTPRMSHFATSAATAVDLAHRFRSMRHVTTPGFSIGFGPVLDHAAFRSLLLARQLQLAKDGTFQFIHVHTIDLLSLRHHCARRRDSYPIGEAQRSPSSQPCLLPGMGGDFIDMHNTISRGAGAGIPAGFLSCRVQTPSALLLPGKGQADSSREA